MDKKLFSKSSNFFKKEGFYVILFVCLCIVATVAAVTTRNSKVVKKQPVAQEAQQNKPTDVAKLSDESSTEHPGALQVKTSGTAGITVQKDGKNAAQQVSKTVDTSFAKPVEGTLARAYSDTPVWWDTTEKWRPNFGMDIKAEAGKPVVAVMDGKVEEVNSSTQDGVQVIINHQNGLKSVYSNMDPKVAVAKGQQVKKGAQIGKVGKTTIRAAYEKYGDHLHFAVMKSKDYVDPAKYIKY
jgi:murein DD-endopeptidase MepM/ murein hydrolase activator NlpD